MFHRRTGLYHHGLVVLSLLIGVAGLAGPPALIATMGRAAQARAYCPGLSGL